MKMIDDMELNDEDVEDNIEENDEDNKDDNRQRRSRG